jgi:AbrB family looped-hinge helix DNA binding protein
MAEIATIDGAGRIVVPKPLRDRHGLAKGVRLRIVEDGDRLVLEPLTEHNVPVDVDGLLVIRGNLRGVPDHRELRETRISHLAGGKR